MCNKNKTRYLVQRVDTEEFFIHPSDNPREFRQWIKDPLKAHRWVDYDSCAAAVPNQQKWSGAYHGQFVLTAISQTCLNTRVDMTRKSDYFEIEVVVSLATSRMRELIQGHLPC